MLTRVKSKGLATRATELTLSCAWPATASIDMIPPRHQPTSCTGAPPESSDTASTALGMTSSTQCSSPSARSFQPIGP
jgi:hypothetical protein